MKRIVIIAILMMPLLVAFGQQQGTIEIVLSNPEITSLIDAYKAEGEKDQTIKGYRVQILSADNRNDINRVKSQFYTLFPDVKSFVIYQQPNFKLRVGNFRTRLEAHKVWQEVVKSFPGAFITPDELKLSEF